MHDTTGEGDGGGGGGWGEEILDGIASPSLVSEHHSPFVMKARRTVLMALKMRWCFPFGRTRNEE